MTTCSCRQLVRELYQSKQGYVDPVNLLKRLAALDAGEEFINGGQHDCEELLSAVMDRLHTDLVRCCSITPNLAFNMPVSSAVVDQITYLCVNLIVEIWLTSCGDLTMRRSINIYSCPPYCCLLFARQM